MVNVINDASLFAQRSSSLIFLLLFVAYAKENSAGCTSHACAGDQKVKKKRIK